MGFKKNNIRSYFEKVRFLWASFSESFALKTTVPERNMVFLKIYVKLRKLRNFTSYLLRKIHKDHFFHVFRLFLAFFFYIFF